LSYQFSFEGARLLTLNKIHLSLISLVLASGCSGSFSAKSSGSGEFASTSGGFASLTAVSSYGAATVTGTGMIFNGSLNLYSVATERNITDLIVMGGWMDTNDFALKDDRLYQGSFDANGIRGAMWPLRLVNPGAAAGYIPGYHANDPTVTYMPNSGFHFMYFTLLHNAYQTFEEIVTRNWVGFASSPDGVNWYSHGPLIGQWNGHDGRGAWSPSVVNMGSELWLYYNTGGTDYCPGGPSTCSVISTQGGVPSSISVMRTRLSLNGWQQLGTDVVNAPISTFFLNVDVTYAFGKFWMVGNDSSLKKILLYFSDDGVNFTPFDSNQGLLVDATPNGFFTPHIVPTGASTFDVYFSVGQGGGGAQSSHKWSFALQGAVGGGAAFAPSAARAPAVAAPAATAYSMAAAQSNDELWAGSMASVIDNNPGTIYSSGNFGSPANDRGTFLAAWLADGPKSVNTVIMQGRNDSGRVQAFPSTYRVYISSPDNTAWVDLGSYSNQPDVSGRLNLRLGGTYTTYAVLIIPTALGTDIYGGYYFQMADLGLGLF
jgi:hypothetical protein